MDQLSMNELHKVRQTYEDTDKDLAGWTARPPLIRIFSPASPTPSSASSGTAEQPLVSYINQTIHSVLHKQ